MTRILCEESVCVQSVFCSFCNDGPDGFFVPFHSTHFAWTLFSALFCTCLSRRVLGFWWSGRAGGVWGCSAIFPGAGIILRC